MSEILTKISRIFDAQNTSSYRGFQFICAVPALVANGTNTGQFHTLSGLSDMHQQDITSLSDQELGTIEGQGHLVPLAESLAVMAMRGIQWHEGCSPKNQKRPTERLRDKEEKGMDWT